MGRWAPRRTILRSSRSAAHAIAQPSGLPRKVCVCRLSPRDAPHASIAALVPRQTESGKPPAIALPKQSRSGRGTGGAAPVP